MAEAPRGIQATLFDYFKDTEYFDLQEANELLLEHQQRDINSESIRARIYEGIDKGLFERVGKGLYTVSRKDEQGRENTCLLINGDGRDLSMLQDNSVDAIITDHPYQLTSSLKGGNRNFADYELFQYNEQDFREKLRVLKPGHFLVEFLPEENGDNYEYLFKVKDLARKAGFEYYAKVPWKKGDFVANTGRKSKNTEDICFFSKGRARDLRPDAKKDKQYEKSREIVEYKEHIPGSVTVHYSEMGSMGTSYETRLEPIDVDIRISVNKGDVDRAKDLLDTAFDNAVVYDFEDSPLDVELGGEYTYEQLGKMSTQEYMLKYLETCDLEFVDLSPGPRDIFDARTSVIVNPTNLIGPMGAGLAKEFRDKYSGLEETYKESCRQRTLINDISKDGFRSLSGGGNEILIAESRALFEGNLFLMGPSSSRPAILCFPTKRHWKDPSDLTLIEAGLKTFVKDYKKFNIRSITFPKLGCGLGGLDWEKDVKPLMKKYLGNLPDLDVQICGDTLREDKQEHFMSGAAGMLPTVFDIAAPNKREKIHQAEKPTMLLEQILRYVTREDEWVLDQFSGSGVLGEAALNSHRNSILIEKDVETFNKLRERIESLGNVDVQTKEQRIAIGVAVDALEAVYDGPDCMDAFAEHQNGQEMTLPDAFAVLSGVSGNPHIEGEQEAIAAACQAIQAVDLHEESRQNMRSEMISGGVHPEDVDTILGVVEEKQRESILQQEKVLECSSRGDKRFSALYAKVSIRGREQSIEEWYQNAKRTADGKRAGKGKPFDHIVDPFTGDKLPAKEAQWLYRGLWITYLKKNPDLVEYASQFDKFTDSFRNERTFNCQADVIEAYVKGDRDRYVSVVQCSDWYKNMSAKLSAKKKTSLSDQIQAAEHKATEQQTSLFDGNKTRSAHNPWEK